MPWVESSPFRNWVEWTWVDLEKCQVLGRQHIDFDPIPFDPIRPQSIRPKLFDQKGRPNSFRPISFDPFHAIHFRPPLEPRGLYQTDGKRPDCVTMTSCKVGKQLVLDVTVVDALAPSRLNGYKTYCLIPYCLMPYCLILWTYCLIIFKQYG